MALVRLTQSRVNVLKPRKHACELRDRETGGFGIRVLPSGEQRDSGAPGTCVGARSSRTLRHMVSPLLDARGLTKRFPVGRGREERLVHAVNDVDIAVDEGQTHGLVGESGSAKSTTGRLLLRLIEPDAGAATFKGVNLFALDEAAMRRIRREFQIVCRDPFSSVDPRFRARDIVAEPWVNHGMYDRAERRRRAHDLFARVELDPAQGERRSAAFSGGQLQRIGIARALALEPSLVICDEPVSALDVSVRGQIINLLTELHRDLGGAPVYRHAR